MESDCFCICLPTWLWVRTAWSQHETHPKPVLQVKEQNTASINHIFTGSQSSWKCVEWKPWSQILPWTRQERPAWHLLVGLDKGKRGRTREHQSQNWWLLHDTTITSITSSKKWQTNAEKWLWPFHSICLRRIEMEGTWTNYETAVSLEFFRVLSWYPKSEMPWKCPSTGFAEGKSSWSRPLELCDNRTGSNLHLPKGIETQRDTKCFKILWGTVEAGPSQQVQVGMLVVWNAAPSQPGLDWSCTVPEQKRMDFRKSFDSVIQKYSTSLLIYELIDAIPLYISNVKNMTPRDVPFQQAPVTCDRKWHDGLGLSLDLSAKTAMNHNSHGWPNCAVRSMSEFGGKKMNAKWAKCHIANLTRAALLHLLLESLLLL